MLDFILFGTRTVTVKAPTDDSAVSILCPHCSRRAKSRLFIKKTYRTCFFIPTDLLKTSDPYIGCDNCFGGFGQDQIRTCSSCQQIVVGETDFCGQCGIEVKRYDQKL